MQSLAVELDKLVTYTFNPLILKDYKYLVENMISVQGGHGHLREKLQIKCFNTKNYFAEDFWFTFIIKKHSRIKISWQKELYAYRQHSNMSGVGS